MFGVCVCTHTITGVGTGTSCARASTASGDLGGAWVRFEGTRKVQYC